MSVLEKQQVQTASVREPGMGWWQAGLLGVGAAAVANLVILAVARLGGVSFAIVNGSEEGTVDVPTVLGLSIVPMAVGIAVVMLVSVWWVWALRVGAVVGAGLALATIALPFSVDEAETGARVALALMHVTVAAGIVFAFEAYRRSRVGADH